MSSTRRRSFLSRLVSCAAGALLLTGGGAWAQDSGSYRDRGARYEAGRAEVEARSAGRVAREVGRDAGRSATRGSDYSRDDGRLRNRTDDNRTFTPSPRDYDRGTRVEPDLRYVPERRAVRAEPTRDYDRDYTGRYDRNYDGGYYQPLEPRYGDRFRYVRPRYSTDRRSDLTIGGGFYTGHVRDNPFYPSPYRAPYAGYAFGTYVRPDFHYVGPWDYGWSSWWTRPAVPYRDPTYHYPGGAGWYGPWSPGVYTEFSAKTYVPGPFGGIRYERGVYHNWPGYDSPVRLRPLHHYGTPSSGTSFHLRYNYSR